MRKIRRSTVSSQSSNTLKQASSPLIQRKQYVGDVYSSLTYLRKQTPNVQPDSNKKENNKNQDNDPLRKRRIRFVDTELKSKSPTLILSNFTKMVNKCQVEREKHKKHFNCPTNPELLAFTNQSEQPENTQVSISKYRKITQDFAEGIDKTDRQWSVTHEPKRKQGKRRKYQNDLFLSSSQLGITEPKKSTKKIFLERTHSSIQLS